MRLRWLLWVALLLAISAFAQQSASPATPAQPAVQMIAKPESVMSEIKVECVPASRASELIDKHGCVAGKVFRVTSQKNGNTRIALCAHESECSFQAVVFARDREQVGDLSYLHGRLVAFLGEVTEYRGQAEIVLKNRKQIQVAAGNPPSEFDAAQPKPVSGGQTPHGSKRGRAW